MQGRVLTPNPYCIVNPWIKNEPSQIKVPKVPRYCLTLSKHLTYHPIHAIVCTWFLAKVVGFL